MRFEKDERNQIPVTDNLGRSQSTTLVNEPGLYKVILRSDKPEAKKFMNWITHEVLPSIRKHGAYIISAKMEELMNDPDTWVKLIRTLQQERKEKELLKNQVEKDKPKVIFCDAVSASDSDILVSEMAKILRGNGIDIGEHRLFERLRNEGFLIRRKGCDKNIPTQRSMNLGLFRIIETAITHSDGHVTIAKTAKITGKGQVYFTKYFWRIRRTATMNNELKIKAMSLFNFMLEKYENDKRVGEFSLYDLIEMEEFLSDGDSDAQN